MLTLFVDVHFGTNTIDALIHRGEPLGFQVETFRNHGQHDLDPQHLLRAATNGWTILTRDFGYIQLNDLWYVVNLWRPLDPPVHHAGILCVVSEKISDPVVVDEVIAFLELHRDRDLRDQLFTLEGPVGAASWRQHRPFARRSRAQVR